MIYCILFHRLYRTASLYSGYLAWYNVVITSRVHSSVKKYSQRSRHWLLTAWVDPWVTAAVSCDGGMNVLNHCMSWSKFVNTHLSHSRQWYWFNNIIVVQIQCAMLLNCCNLTQHFLTSLNACRCGYIYCSHVFCIKCCDSGAMQADGSAAWRSC